VLARLWHLSGDDAYRDRFDRLVAAVAAKDVRQLIHQPTLLNAFELMATGRQVVVVGEADDPATGALAKVAVEAGFVNQVLAKIPPGGELPKSHPARGKGLVGGKPAAYVCAGGICGLPVTEPGNLAEELARR
jgi:uncharacterized protein YyaL (SSP411 family)